MAWPNDVYDPYSNDPNRFGLFGGQPDDGRTQPSDPYQPGPRQPLRLPGQTPQVASWTDGMSDNQLASPPPSASQADPYTTWFNRMQAMYGPRQQPTDQQPTGLFGGNRFSTITGLMANAISPYSWGGRLGGLMANYNMQQDQWDRYGQMQQARLGLMQNRPFATNPNQTVWQQGPDGQLHLVGYSAGAPPATPMGSRREGYTTPDGTYHPPVEGEWSPRQATVPLNPGQTGYTPGAAEQYTAPPDPNAGVYLKQNETFYPGGDPNAPPLRGIMTPHNVPNGGTAVPGDYNYGGQPLTVPDTNVRHSFGTVAPGAGIVQQPGAPPVQVTGVAPLTPRQASTGSRGPTEGDKAVGAALLRLRTQFTTAPNREAAARDFITKQVQANPAQQNILERAYAQLQQEWAGMADRQRSITRTQPQPASVVPPTLVGQKAPPGIPDGPIRLRDGRTVQVQGGVVIRMLP